MDLFYRLRVLAIELPPLRDRQDDIPLLALHYLTRFAEQQRKRVRELGPRVLDELGRYDWPGNVRELANVMEAEVSLAPPDVDLLERLATRLVGRFRTAANVGSTGRVARDSTSTTLEQSIVPLAEVEKRAILHAIERCGGSVSRRPRRSACRRSPSTRSCARGGCTRRMRLDETGEGPQRARGGPSARLPVSRSPAAPPTSRRLPSASPAPVRRARSERPARAEGFSYPNRVHVLNGSES